MVTAVLFHSILHKYITENFAELDKLVILQVFLNSQDIASHQIMV